MAWAEADIAQPDPARMQAKKPRRKLLNDFERVCGLAGPGPLRAGNDLFMGTSHGSCFKHCPNDSSVQAQWSNLFRTGIGRVYDRRSRSPEWCQRGLSCSVAGILSIPLDAGEVVTGSICTSEGADGSGGPMAASCWRRAAASRSTATPPGTMTGAL